TVRYGLLDYLRLPLAKLSELLLCCRPGHRLQRLPNCLPVFEPPLPRFNVQPDYENLCHARTPMLCFGCRKSKRPMRCPCLLRLLPLVPEPENHPEPVRNLRGGSSAVPSPSGYLKGCSAVSKPF